MTVVQVQDFAGAARGIATTTLRAVIGDISLDDVLARREQINNVLRTKLDEVTERWGVKVTTVEIREILPPREVQEAMTRQMSAERSRRAVVTEADGKRQATITVAEGDKQSAILRAEGDRQAALPRAGPLASAHRGREEARDVLGAGDGKAGGQTRPRPTHRSRCPRCGGGHLALRPTGRRALPHHGQHDQPAHRRLRARFRDRAFRPPGPGGGLARPRAAADLLLPGAAAARLLQPPAGRGVPWHLPPRAPVDAGGAAASGLQGLRRLDLSLGAAGRDPLPAAAGKRPGGGPCRGRARGGGG